MNEYFKIKDQCRQGLIRHLDNACGKIPRLSNCTILDIGCGTGVPTLWLAENFPGSITAIDVDFNAINYLQQKINDRNLQNRIKSICVSFDEFACQNSPFNFILAEGFLNVAGFESGFLKIDDLLSNQGIVVIHDEYNDYRNKLEFISKKNYTLIDTLVLNEHIWWNDYYKQLESKINGISDMELKNMFKSDSEEINLYKTNPSLFQSIYYIAIKK